MMQDHDLDYYCEQIKKAQDSFNPRTNTIKIILEIYNQGQENGASLEKKGEWETERAYSR
jgi:hypothetical protein